MSERCERTSERRGEWPNTPRVDFIVILPNVRRSHSRGNRHLDERNFVFMSVVLVHLDVYSVTPNSASTVAHKTRKCLIFSRFRAPRFALFAQLSNVRARTMRAWAKRETYGQRK